MLNNELPKFMMFLFDGEDDKPDDTPDDTPDDKPDDTPDDKPADKPDDKPVDKSDKADKKVVIPGQKTGESDAQYGKRIRELEEANKAKNQENANRRRENNDLNLKLDTVNRRLVTADAKAALADAGSISKRAVELFLSDHADDVRIDPKTGNTTGLDKIAEWKKANPEFFKSEEDKNDDKKDDKGDDKKDKKNSSAKGGSRGSGAGLDDKGTAGLADLATLKNPQERDAAIRAYKQSLKGSGSGYGYGKASSKR